MFYLDTMVSKITWMLLGIVVVSGKVSGGEHTPYGTTALHGHIKLERKAYTAFYDPGYRLSTLVAYHIIPEYRDTPKWKGRFKRLRSDPDIDSPVTNDYKHSGFSRGHLAPYFIAGGDRDKDGQKASIGIPSDPDDELTVFEVNYMTNITPQHQNCFNGSAGVWYALETFVRKKLVEEAQEEVWVYAGAIIDTDDEHIGPDNNIAVPDRFFKVIVQKQQDGKLTALSFLFPHYRKVDGQCNDGDKRFFEISHLTTIDKIEALTNIRFFALMEDNAENEIESTPSLEVWSTYYKHRL